jgi:hypothetical protein
LREAVERAKKAAWDGQSINGLFRGTLEFASIGDCSMIFLDGEYVGEVNVDRAERERTLPRGFIRVHQPFLAQHRFHYISDPRRFAPGFPDDRGRFPSRDTAAMALLELLIRHGTLRRFEASWGLGGEEIDLLSISSASLAVPWCRVAFNGEELAWLMIDRRRTGSEGRWEYHGPPALGRFRTSGHYQSRTEAALALVEALKRTHAERPERFMGPSAVRADGSENWNRVALDLLEALKK